jgi:hypothetical protein
MAQLTWNEFSTAALTMNGLLSDLLANANDPNSVLKSYGLGELSLSDVTRWQDVLASDSATPTQKEVLQFIATLLPGPDSAAPLSHEVPPTW